MAESNEVKMTGDDDAFDNGTPERQMPSIGEQFIVDVSGFEGPIDMLLTLARDQKVDLKHISILALADQYLAFVAHARRINLELAADYLVMAAWLAYLKSRLLLPEDSSGEQPTGEEMAEALQFQLRRLSAMQEAGEKLLARARLGQDFFKRGAPEEFASIYTTVFDATLYDLLKAYGDQQRKGLDPTWRPPELQAYSVEEAIQRLRTMLGVAVTWESLWRFLPPEIGTGTLAKSAFASTFAATLELAKEGRLKIRQDEVFGSIYVRSVAEAEIVPVEEKNDKEDS
jgi:segregation and condensation protein A